MERSRTCPSHSWRRMAALAAQCRAITAGEYGLRLPAVTANVGIRRRNKSRSAFEGRPETRVKSNAGGREEGCNAWRWMGEGFPRRWTTTKTEVQTERRRDSRGLGGLVLARRDECYASSFAENLPLPIGRPAPDLLQLFNHHVHLRRDPSSSSFRRQS